MGIRVVHTIRGLERDLIALPRKATRGFAAAVRSGAQKGNRAAKVSAKKKSGQPGKHHHKAYRPERISALEWVYGPIATMPQGGMDFEEGSGHQTAPHHNLKDSQPVAARELHEQVSDVLDNLFW